jgi:hypothetical protein
MKDFKYTSKFDISAAVNIGVKECFASNNLISHASLDDLKNLMPPEEIRGQNPDLLYTAFPAFVVNLVNSNDDGIMTNEALALAPLFKDKQTNIEHMRSYIVGHVIGHGFSSFPNNDEISSKDLEGTKDPFNVSLASVIYRVADQYFAETLEDSANPQHYLYKDISASWELGFDEFVLALGSKQISEAEIVDQDSQIKELSKFLRAEGGSGFTDDGVPVYRLVMGNSVPLGIGYTSNPAAAVRGITVASADSTDPPPLSEEHKKSVVSFVLSNAELAEQISSFYKEQETSSKISPPDPLEKDLDKNTTKSEKKNKKTSQSTKRTVIKNTMKINSIDDIQQDKWEEIEASDMRDFVRNQLKIANDKYVALTEEALAKEAKLEQEKSDAASQNEKNAADLKVVQAELETLKKESAEAAQVASFNERMASLSEDYELNDGVRKVIAKQIRSLSNEEYTEWREEFDILQASNKESEASTAKTAEQLAEEALAAATVKGGTPPNSASGEEDPMDEYAKSFQLGKGVVIRN